ncbi:MAG: hypothetical protein JSU70_18750 [Phycisphaerales bacterium]|nr:MAG: hypothetical protein JSU70_18750 [Phycisphaerales bacterium]
MSHIRRLLRHPTAVAALILGILGILGAVTEVSCHSAPTGRRADPNVLTQEEIDGFRIEVNQAAQEVTIFDPDRISRAARLLGRALGDERLETADPTLAAKAHRVMAAVHFCADLCRSTSPDVKKLATNAYGKATYELQESLRLDPNQTDARELRTAIEKLKEMQSSGRLPLLEYDGLIGTLVNSLKK